MNATLYYVHDPMCSWCWAFDGARASLFQGLPDHITVVRLLGGLAGDNDQPMPADMRKYVQENWRNIEQKLPHIRFNYDFWQDCVPRRATYPACRAVIAARMQGGRFDEEMTRAIQQAYYQEAKNPSEKTVLIDLAGELGLNAAEFSDALSANSAQEILRDEITQVRRLKADSFPALVLQIESARWRVPIDYEGSDSMLEMINMLLEE